MLLLNPFTASARAYVSWTLSFIPLCHFDIIVPACSAVMSNATAIFAACSVKPSKSFCATPAPAAAAAICARPSALIGILRLMRSSSRFIRSSPSGVKSDTLAKSAIASSIFMDACTGPEIADFTDDAAAPRPLKAPIPSVIFPAAAPKCCMPFAFASIFRCVTSIWSPSSFCRFFSVTMLDSADAAAPGMRSSFRFSASSFTEQRSTASFAFWWATAIFLVGTPTRDISDSSSSNFAFA